VTGVNELRIEETRDQASLAALGPEWRALQADTGAHNPFVSWEWTSACAANVCPDAEPFVLAVRTADGLLAGIAPLRLERRLGARILRFIGDGRSDYLGFLVDPGVPGVERALLERLLELRRAWDVAVLRHLTPDYSTLAATDVPPGLTAHEIEGTVGSHLAFAGDWKQLLADGPRGVRHSRRWAQKFERRGGEVLRLTGAEARARLDDVCAIEARSWKGEAGTARFQPGPGRDLLGAALESSTAESLELWLAIFDGQPIAFQINFLAPGRVLYYQGAYDKEQRSHYVGGVLHHHAFTAAWAEGRREYDFMVGDEAYKADWCNAERTLRYLAVHPPTARGRAAYRLLVAPRWALKRSGLVRAVFERSTQLRGRLRVRGGSAS